MIFTQLAVGPLQVNCYILADKRTKEAIIIDPGEDAKDILDALKENGLHARYLVITHAHFDHVGANKAIKDATGAEILMHKDDDILLKSAANQGFLFGMRSAASPSADRYVNHGDMIMVGDISLQVLHTPGHSPGGISLLGQGMVFTGDALFAGSIGRTDLPGGDTITLLRSIQNNLMNLPDDTRVYPGHGPASTIGKERRKNPFLNKMA
jgi:hydroxyacylglutathione hydrolase